MSWHALLRRKTVVPDAESSSLKRSMSMFQLALLGVGCTVGTGIFFIFQTAVPKAGPAVICAFLLASAVAALTALCYAELAASIPTSGSAYSYAYATLGEFAAFGVAILLLFEYGIAASAVAVGWSQYINSLLDSAFHISLPAWATHAPNADGFGINLPAVILLLLCGFLLTRGASESAKVNAIMVTITLMILAFFALMAFRGFSPVNLQPFAPNGMGGVMAASGTVFFTFVGIDAICTAGEEVKDPQKNLPRALIVALLIVTGIYALVAVAAVGAQNWELFGTQEASLAVIVSNVVNASWPGMLLALCAIITIFSCTLVTIYGQTRILFAISRDGLMPKSFQKVNKKQTPVVSTWIVIIACALLAAFANLDLLADVASMGTLLTYLVVSIAVFAMRRHKMHAPGAFRAPRWVPAASVIACAVLVVQMSLPVWICTIAIMTVGLISYFAYFQKRSVLAQQDQEVNNLLDVASKASGQEAGEKKEETLASS